MHAITLNFCSNFQKKKSDTHCTPCYCLTSCSFQMGSLYLKRFRKLSEWIITSNCSYTLLINFSYITNDFKSKTLNLNGLESTMISLIKTSTYGSYQAYLALTYGNKFECSCLYCSEKKLSLNGEVGF